MRVRDFMSTDLVTVDINTPILDAQKIMREKNIKRLPVMKNGKLVGLVTKHMLLEASPSPATTLSVYELNYLISKMTVKDIMVKDPITLSPDTPVEEAIRLGTEKGIGGFPIVEDGKLVGIITQTDITKVIYEVLGIKGEGRRITIAGLGGRLGELRDIIEIMDRHKVAVYSLVTIPRKDKGEIVIIIRVESKNVDELVKEMKDKGIKVTDVS